jgi:hypothetical protein
MANARRRNEFVRRDEGMHFEAVWRLRGTLEAGIREDFVAIEPESDEYYLSQSLSAAI